MPQKRGVLDALGLNNKDNRANSCHRGLNGGHSRSLLWLRMTNGSVGGVMENWPDGAGAGRDATEPRSGLFYLMPPTDPEASMRPFVFHTKGLPSGERS